MKTKGFLLAETLINVCIIMVCIAFMALPFIEMVHQAALMYEAQKIVHDIEFVRKLSLMQSEKLKIEWIGFQNRYRFEIAQNGMGKTGKYIERKLSLPIGFPYYFSVNSVRYLDENNIVKTGSINFGSSSTDAFGTLVFDSTGTPNQGGHLVIIEKNTKKAVAIIVKPVTGRVRIGKVHFVSP